MPGFTGYFDDFTTATSVKSALVLHADAAGETAEITDFGMFGSGITAAADTQHTFRVLRSTNGTGGTGTSITPEQLHGGTAASFLTVKNEFSVEIGTLASVYLALIALNQRAGMRWAVPKGAGMWVRNADTNLRWAMQVISAAAGKVDGYAMWRENE